MSSPGLTNVAAVIGDVVNSRSHSDRAHLQRTLQSALEEINHHVPAMEPLTSTIGDEFQGLYVDPYPALHATLLLRLRLAAHVDVRFGIGFGPLTMRVPERAPYAQDGPAWWAARKAIQHAEHLPLTKLGPRHLRTSYQNASDTDYIEHTALVNALLFCRDHIVGEMSERDQELVFGLLTGRKVVDMAEEIDISPSAVSQRNARSGAYALLAATRELEKIFR